MKKLISSIIALAMVMATLPVHFAFAEGEEVEQPAAITIKPYESNIDELLWYTSATTQDDTTKAAVDITTNTNKYTPVKGVTKSVFKDTTNSAAWQEIVAGGYSEAYLSIHGVYAPADSATFTVDENLVIPETGTYNLQYIIGGPSNTFTRNSGIKIEIAPVDNLDAKEIINSYVFTSYSENYKWSGTRSGEYLWLNDKEMANIEAGEYKVYITIYTTYVDYPMQRLTLGDIKLTKAEPTAISATQKTTLEYETYTHYGEEVTEDANASNGAAAISFDGRRHGNEIFVNMPITVSETAVYNWETVLAKGSYTGRTTIFVDGKELVSNANDGEALGTNFTNSTYLPMHKYSGEVVLAAGEHMITTTVAELSSRPDLAVFGMDYLSFQKSDKPLSFTVSPVADSNIGDVTIYSDKTYETSTTNDIATALTAGSAANGITKSAYSGLAKLGYGSEYLSVKGYVKTTSFSFDLTDTITVPKSGYYKMRYAIGGGLGYTAVSGMKLEFAPVASPTTKTVVAAYSPEDYSTTTSKDNADRIGYGVRSSQCVWKCDEEYAYLEAGTYKAAFTLYGLGSSSAGNNYVSLLSPIEFTEATDFEEISTAEKTIIEYEDYSHYGAKYPTVTNASGGAVIGNYGYAVMSPPVSFIIPVTVTEDARYLWKTVLGKGGNCGTTTVYIDGEKLLATSGTGTSLEKNFNDNTAYPMYEFTGETELEAGTHEIKVTNTSGLLRIAADYISFEKAPAKTSYTIQPYAASTLDDIDWYTDSAKTTPATVDLTNVVNSYTAPVGVTKLTFDNLIKKGFGDNYLSIRNVYADTEDGNATFTLDDTLKIEATDFYKLRYAIGGDTGYAFGGVSVELENVNDPTKKNVITRYIPEDYSNDNSNEGAGHGALNNQNVYSNDFNEIAKIEEGEYKVNITVYLPQGESIHQLTLSDISLDATDPVNVPADVKTTLEVEDYTHYGASMNQAEGGVADTSNNAIAWTYYGTPRGNVPVFINIPVNIETEADYTIATHMAKSTAGNTYIYVDGEQVFYNYDGGTLTGKTLHADGNYAMAEYKKKVHLTEGEHLITVSGSTAGNLLRFAVDYVSLEKWYENPVTNKETTRIEMEDYADEFTAAYGETEYESLLETEHDYSYTKLRTKPVALVRFDDAGRNFSNNKAMYGVKETAEPKVVEIPVTIKDSGYYNAKYRVGGAGEANSYAWFDTELVADGGAYSLSEAIFRESRPNAANTQTRINDGDGSYTWQLTSSPVYVPAGTYTLKMTITGKTFLCDYIDIMPVEAADATVGVDFDVMKIEAHAAEGIANGGTIEFADWSFTDKDTETYTYPITVPEDGYYDVEAAMHHYTGPATSNIKLMIDGVVVYNNANTGEDLSVNNEEGNIDYLSSYFRVNKYTGGKIKLTAGAHELQVQTTKTSEKFQYVHKFALDYAKLTKSQDKIEVSETGYVTITANYTSPVTGNLYMAFYHDGKLISAVPAGSANSQTVVVGEEQGPTEDYDYVKLFVWDTGNNLIPDAFAIGFAQ